MFDVYVYDKIDTNKLSLVSHLSKITKKEYLELRKSMREIEKDKYFFIKNTVSV